MSDIKLISEAELALIASPAFNASQMQFLHKVTPAKYIRERPAKGGGNWKYLSGGYVKKTLNLMFGFGKLTVRTNGHTIVKTQFGNKDIAYKKQQQGETERVPLSIGNDLKSAATDALKKCASELGIGADVYNKQEFESFVVVTEDEADKTLEELKALFESKKMLVPATLISRINEIIYTKEVASFNKVITALKAL
jgi:hypothetical protein